eukprot:CAMPEP_0171074496 /NCGR_PEP_ID=MMETSP0766_2-20121228/12176_1 /TAXON_ID=439317 /ORGANISM="Gambierdiscus australes, Strain CAWD 149" /LENGTH=402 /DNA_ID=CAMNT_0011531287 /DNA_START=107 /DNA_END=1315 /DNA_ORIENTATION=-
MPPASQVEFPAPPGLEVSQGSTSGGTGRDTVRDLPQDEMAQGQRETEQELKEALVQEVTARVREHIDKRTNAAVDTLWQRGQKAMRYLEQQQNTQSEHLRGQLEACAESFRSLERENAALRNGLEVLIKRLTTTFGTPPHLAGQPPFFAPPPSTPAAPQQPGAATFAPEQHGAGPPKPTAASVHSDAEDFHTPAPSPQRPSMAEELLHEPTPAVQLPCVPRFPAGAESAEEAAVSQGVGSTEAASTAPPSRPLTPLSGTSSQPAALPFTLTLRRADNVPLGLDVRGDTGDSFLVVEAVRPGGAVEAWNRQCAGDMREIRAGDRIIAINGAEDADSMREQCLAKHLLRMTVIRGTGGGAEQPVAAPQPLQQSERSGLRADASEFVPQVGSWAAFMSASGTTPA